MDGCSEDSQVVCCTVWQKPHWLPTESSWTDMTSFPSSQSSQTVFGTRESLLFHRRVVWPLWKCLFYMFIKNAEPFETGKGRREGPFKQSSKPIGRIRFQTTSVGNIAASLWTFTSFFFLASTSFCWMIIDFCNVSTLELLVIYSFLIKTTNLLIGIFLTLARSLYSLLSLIVYSACFILTPYIMLSILKNEVRKKTGRTTSQENFKMNMRHSSHFDSKSVFSVLSFFHPDLSTAQSLVKPLKTNEIISTLVPANQV